MTIIWRLNCDFGHHWSIETEDREKITPWLLHCPFGHPGVLGIELEKADVAIIIVKPTSLIYRSTGQFVSSRKPHFSLELRNNRTGQSHTIPINVEWRRLRDLLERIQGKSFAEAIEAATAFPELRSIPTADTPK